MVKRVPGDGGAETAHSQEGLPSHLSASGTSNSTSASRSLSATVTHHTTSSASSPPEPQSPHLPSGDKTLTPPSPGAAARSYQEEI